ncbi:hypothetical protein [Streptomyces rapamycinicus]|uniref:Uncharacterized protein n=1 Tax=Streptomyces rapamycinicus TaxID=1226757 RepID=A0ABR6LZI2_9ACTN|nr:hypothetical protein [Streptomyces rapamycinicus]MBB4787067.1 hypothetical protein [Streptomyces rapamycinicus]UTO67050.1 hypothetical protein LJB45_35285 [Streptomyces rapamycinicus]UTP35009.1 hypothetical protein LIV37_40430 [Streptomyces rapamycinicus NRRL 5491]
MHADRLEDGVEAVGEVGAAVPDEEADRLCAVSEVHEVVPCLLGDPGAGRVPGDAGDVHVSGAVVDEEQHEPAPQEDRVDVEEVGGHDGGGLGFEEGGPGLVGALGCGVDPGLLQDLPDGPGAEFASQAEQFAADPLISPPGVLPREAQDQLPQCFRRRWSARTAVCIGPLPGHETCVPAQDRPWSDQQHQPCTLLLVHHPEQRCHDSPITPGN